MPVTTPPGEPAPGGGGSGTNPAATAIYDPPPVAQARAGMKSWVRRHDGSALPNVRLQSWSVREFLPPEARFRYAWTTPGLTPKADDPRRVEDCFALTSNRPRVVKIDDRVRVMRQVGTRGVDILFDGFLVAPQATLGGNSETVGLTVLGTPIREWDTPLPGAVMRDSDGLDADPAEDDADLDATRDVRTDLPARFNPDGLPNAIPEGHDSALFRGAENEITYPVFADASLPGTADLRLWDLAMAVRYCLCVGNPDQEYVTLGDLDALDDLLRAVRPKPGASHLDLADEATYDLVPIVVPDLDVTGMAWPDAVRRLIEPHGFAFRFELSTDALDAPEWRVAFYRKDDPAGAKLAYLQRPPAGLVPGKSTVAELDMVRDCAGVQNRWLVATEPVRFEASFVLAPAFAVDADDLLTANAYLYVKGVDETVFDPELYRVFVADEAGEGHWDFLTGTTETTPANLRPLFQPGSEATDARTYARRRRAPDRVLATKDNAGERRECELWVSTNYSGEPGLWDRGAANLNGTGTGGTWQRVTKGGWRLLEDRIGIELTMPDPRNWAIGDPKEVPDGKPFKGAIVNVPACQNGPEVSPTAPTPTNPRFRFRLTCVIDGDHDIEAEAKKRPSSPTQFTITRYDDSRDRFKKRVVSRYSHLAASSSADAAIEDDTAEATAHAEARRRANESGAFSGSLTVPYFTDAYRVGDKLKGLSGRGVSFACNAATESGEAPQWPCVVSISYTVDPGESTVVQLQDYRAEPAPETRGRRRV